MRDISPPIFCLIAQCDLQYHTAGRDVSAGVLEIAGRPSGGSVNLRGLPSGFLK
jgi:hypothetical protein